MRASALSRAWCRKQPTGAASVAAVKARGRTSRSPRRNEISPLQESDEVILTRIVGWIASLSLSSGRTRWLVMAVNLLRSQIQKHKGEERMRTNATLLALAVAALIGAAQTASAEDTVKLAIGQRGNWDTSVSEIGQRAGIFKKHGLKLEMVYTNGSGETQQAVISGSVNLGIAGGIMGALSAYSKGAPVRIIS